MVREKVPKRVDEKRVEPSTLRVRVYLWTELSQWKRILTRRFWEARDPDGRGAVWSAKRSWPEAEPVAGKETFFPLRRLWGFRWWRFLGPRRVW